MAKCKKMADGGSPFGGPAVPAGNPKAAAAMAAKKKAKVPGAPAAAPVGSGVSPTMMKKGGSCKKFAKGGGIESRGKTKGKIV